MDIIGLGTAACNIVECFSKYPQYSLYKIDTEERDGKFFRLKSSSTPEESEEVVPDMTDFFSDPIGAPGMWIGLTVGLFVSAAFVIARVNYTTGRGRSRFVLNS